MMRHGQRRISKLPCNTKARTICLGFLLGPQTTWMTSLYQTSTTQNPLVTGPRGESFVLIRYDEVPQQMDLRSAKLALAE